MLEKFGFTTGKHMPTSTPAASYDNLRPANETDTRINVSEF